MKRVRKFLSLTYDEQGFLIKIALLIGVIRLGFLLLPFHILQRLLAKIPQMTVERRKIDQTYVEKVVWAVKVASNYIPGAQCFERAVATHLLLSRRGYPSRLCIGLVQGRGEKLQGHAWVENERKIVIGYLADLSRYSKLPSGKTIDNLLNFCLAFQLKNQLKAN